MLKFSPKKIIILNFTFYFILFYFILFYFILFSRKKKKSQLAGWFAEKEESVEEQVEERRLRPW